MSDTATYVQVEGCDAVETADGMVVYQTEIEKVHYLNPTAAIVFELCDSRQTADAMARFLQTMFELTEAPAAEVADCIRDLIGEGLIRACPT